MALAGVVVLGCILPFSGGNLGGSFNVFTLPSGFRQLGQIMGASVTPFLAYAIFLIPVMAGILLLNGLAGAVDKARQVYFGIANILLCVLLPGVVASIITLFPGGEMGRIASKLGNKLGGGWSPLDLMQFDFGAGGWLIILASIGLILSGLGKIKIAR
jgi:hypothetical protein